MWIATPRTSFLALSPHVALWGVRLPRRGRGVRKLVASWLQFSGGPDHMINPPLRGQGGTTLRGARFAHCSD